ncbi:hypothetical protein [Maricaulis parjimensis]|uniref:hypothetical protein n=1 Tax=Maricaulis parjimensis TaxID=144023 RepID=UPI00193ADA7C|nr:hypothetical protein [Maricaulis parjimensis]
MPATIELDLGLHKALEAHRTSLDESQTDILRRVLANAPLPADPSPPSAPIPHDWLDMEETAGRQTGRYRVRLHDREYFAGSQKSAYRLALIWLAKTRPDLLDILSKDGTGRRRVVARSPEALYPRSPQLTKHAEKLCDGWYVDVNLSREQKLARIKTACRLAGLEYDKDLIVEL